MNWYTVSYSTGTGNRTEWIEGPDAGTVAAEVRYTLGALYNLKPSVMVRRAVLKEWNRDLSKITLGGLK